MKNKRCPFCRGEVIDHPDPEFTDSYFICIHEEDCFFWDHQPPYNFTLIPKNYMIKRWNKRRKY
jgi:hypothetical protein